MKLFEGKTGIIMGIANEKSIAWGIAEALYKNGAKLILTYPNEVLEKRVRPIAEQLGNAEVYECDVSNEKSIDDLYENIAQNHSQIDFFLHSVAFSDKNELQGRYIDTSLENFLNTMHISCFSFTSVAKRIEKLMINGGSMATMTYYGAEKVMPNYNVMGVAKAALESSVKYMAMDLGRKNIRVNAISAGPMKTLAASGIGDFKYILKWNEYNTPLKRNITLQDVAGAGTFILSDLSSGITGEVLHVDSGYHVVGMKVVDAPDIATV